MSGRGRAVGALGWGGGGWVAVFGSGLLCLRLLVAVVLLGQGLGG